MFDKSILNAFLFLVDVNEKATTFYAVARGKEAGVFDNYVTVKKHV